MTLSVADIAKMALDGVAGAVSGVVLPLTVMHDVTGLYDPTSGSYVTTVVTDTGRVVVATSTPVADIFPSYVAGPADLLVLAEGLAIAPEENWTATFNGSDHVIKRVLDIAGGAYYLVVA